MYGNSEDLTPRQERAVAALLTSRSLAAAARKAEVCESTLRRWVKEPLFQSQLRQARRESFSRAVGTLRQVAESAVAVLESVMRDPKASHASRLRAAQTALRYGSPAPGTGGLEKEWPKRERAQSPIEEADADGR